MELFDSASELSRMEEDDEVKDIISNIGRYAGSNVLEHVLKLSSNRYSSRRSRFFLGKCLKAPFWVVSLGSRPKSAVVIITRSAGSDHTIPNNKLGFLFQVKIVDGQTFFSCRTRT